MTNSTMTRRAVLGATAVTGTGFVLAASCESAALQGVTPAQTEGPFYPIVEQADKDADLTQVEDNAGTALGEVITVEGQVSDDAGNPIVDAVVDIWQANAAGRYAHGADPNTAPLDPNFQGWAIMKTDANGRYRFKTVRPGAYPVDETWTRPPHVHFKVSRRGYREVTTQMYFDGEVLNGIDKLLNDVSEDMRLDLVAKRSDAAEAFQFNVVLAKI